MPRSISCSISRPFGPRRGDGLPRALARGREWPRDRDGGRRGHHVVRPGPDLRMCPGIFTLAIRAAVRHCAPFQRTVPFRCIARGLADGLFYPWERNSLLRHENRIVELSRPSGDRESAMSLVREQLDDPILRRVPEEARVQIYERLAGRLARHGTGSRPRCAMPRRSCAAPSPALPSGPDRGPGTGREPLGARRDPPALHRWLRACAGARHRVTDRQHPRRAAHRQHRRDHDSARGMAERRCDGAGRAGWCRVFPGVPGWVLLPRTIRPGYCRTHRHGRGQCRQAPPHGRTGPRTRTVEPGGIPVRVAPRGSTLAASVEPIGHGDRRVVRKRDGGAGSDRAVDVVLDVPRLVSRLLG